ncbi:transposase, IS605 OrfB family [Thermosinus carboxydivorans Nor1]|uniref:Transposase, IS605 OrfB family n=1 Tax=Thermosinus carboxydivorans Nor1 TaxID=401526 RepID=A1HRF5_9FIRM|nr:RNA-guided endonuclease TnpB family protein [Thermosinus carboxydivorans]EAX47470.1 transposase, IS605 OrfB family [Thermosinus carboxydivorans Nor1]
MQTITLKMKLLSPNKGKLEKMIRMLEIYHQACSWFLAQAEALNTVSRAVLNRETYKQASGLFDLNRGTLQCAMLKALSARRSYLSRKQRGKKASLPKFETMVPVMVRQDCYSLHQLPSGTWVIKFPVSSGRSQIAVPIAASLYHVRKLIDLARGSCRQGSMEIWRDKGGEWYVSISLIYEPSFKEPSGVIGVDFGIVKLAVLSNNIFFDGRPIRWRKEHWAERRKALQQTGRLSRMKKEAGHERRWMRYINHCISKRIVQIAKDEGKAIALEQLTGIRERVRGSKKFNRMLSGWNFKELASFIEYKAALAGVLVFYVDPKETSKTCQKCGNVSRCNRKTQGWFKCIKCGYQSDADRVGALNIAAKALNALGA